MQLPAPARMGMPLPRLTMPRPAMPKVRVPLPAVPRLGLPRGSGRRGPGAPPVRLLVTEGPRAAVELGVLGASLPLMAVQRRGDGHPVLVLPGLLGGDASTAALRAYLSLLGYSVSGWNLGANVGPTEKVVSGLRDRVEKLAEDAGRPVSLVGWSLGGLYAHELARRSPASVRQVLTLGSPVRLARAGKAGSRLFDQFSHLNPAPSAVPRPWSEAGPLRVPVTAVYTKGDGIVDWRSCRVRPGARRENVEVYGSHYGLAHNPTVLHVLADRLAQPERGWRPFRPNALVRHAYP
jgi:pimeloyl-ACP methyl ester carboxylesterase